MIFPCINRFVCMQAWKTLTTTGRNVIGALAVVALGKQLGLRREEGGNGDGVQEEA